MSELSPSSVLADCSPPDKAPTCDHTFILVQLSEDDSAGSPHLPLKASTISVERKAVQLRSSLAGDSESGPGVVMLLSTGMGQFVIFSH